MAEYKDADFNPGTGSSSITTGTTPSDETPATSDSNVTTGTTGSSETPATSDSTVTPTTSDSTLVPSRGAYSAQGQFRFWCQKVLPLVYDDSLSYYELLCKVVDYLNKTMQNVAVLESDVTETNNQFANLQTFVNETVDKQAESFNQLQENLNANIKAQDAAFQQLQDNLNADIEKQNTAFNELQTNLNNNIKAQNEAFEQFQTNINGNIEKQDKAFEDLQTYTNDQIATIRQTYLELQQYVNDYFNNLDVQEEINNKLDTMASDGSLSKLIQPLFDAYKADIDKTVSDQNEALTRMNSRIDNITGQTGTDTTEIVDARFNSATNTTYPSLEARLTADYENVGIYFNQQGTVLYDTSKKTITMPLGQVLIHNKVYDMTEEAVLTVSDDYKGIIYATILANNEGHVSIGIMGYTDTLPDNSFPIGIVAFDVIYNFGGMINVTQSSLLNNGLAIYWSNSDNKITFDRTSLELTIPSRAVVCRLGYKVNKEFTITLENRTSNYLILFDFSTGEISATLLSDLGATMSTLNTFILGIIAHTEVWICGGLIDYTPIDTQFHYGYSVYGHGRAVTYDRSTHELFLPAGTIVLHGHGYLMNSDETLTLGDELAYVIYFTPNNDQTTVTSGAVVYGQDLPENSTSVGIVYGNYFFGNEFVDIKGNPVYNQLASVMPDDGTDITYNSTTHELTFPLCTVHSSRGGAITSATTITVGTDHNLWIILWHRNTNTYSVEYYTTYTGSTLYTYMVGCINKNMVWINGYGYVHNTRYNKIGTIITNGRITSHYTYDGSKLTIPAGYGLMVGDRGKAHYVANPYTINVTSPGFICYDPVASTFSSVGWLEDIPEDSVVIGEVYNHQCYLFGHANDQDCYTGKKIAVFGDSIVAGIGTTCTWEYMLSRYGRFASNLNYGIGSTGYTISNSSEITAGNGTEEPVGTATAQAGDNTVLDVMKATTFTDWIIFAGTNDIGASVDTDTFKTKVNETITYALTKSYRGLVITPIRGTGLRNTNLDTYTEAIIDVCKTLGVQYVDSREIVQLNPTIDGLSTLYYSDGLHPNFAGCNAMALHYLPKYREVFEVPFT